MLPRKDLIVKGLIMTLVVILSLAGCTFDASDPATTGGTSTQGYTDTSGSSTSTEPAGSLFPSPMLTPGVTQTPGISTSVTPTQATTAASGTNLPSQAITPGITGNPTIIPTPAGTTRPADQIDYRQEMRDFVRRISLDAKSQNSRFAVIPQNGEDLVMEAKQLQKDYLNAIDGIGREDFLYGYQQDNIATPASDRNYILTFLNRFKTNQKTVLITDYCSSESKVIDSYQTNSQYGFISFAADQRDLNSIPSSPQPLFNENNTNISALSEARNFLYIINPERYRTKSAFVDAIAGTNYDLVIVDLFFHDTALTRSDVASLQVKDNGARRMVICYMSIGEAEDYRYYWENSWTGNPPHWLLQENPDWPGNYKVKYWDPEWQRIMFGQESAYLSLILRAGFDGVYMDLIDAYEYFTN